MKPRLTEPLLNAGKNFRFGALERRRVAEACFTGTVAMGDTPGPIAHGLPFHDKGDFMYAKHRAESPILQRQPSQTDLCNVTIPALQQQKRYRMGAKCLKPAI